MERLRSEKREKYENQRKQEKIEEKASKLANLIKIKLKLSSKIKISVVIDGFLYLLIKPLKNKVLKLILKLHQ